MSSAQRQESEMEEKKNPLTSFVQAFSSALRAVPEEDLNKLEDERYTIEIRVVRKKEAVVKKTVGSSEEYQRLFAELQLLDTRDEVNQFLAERFTTRALLEGFARHLDMPISKQDKLGDLRDKIVESTIGARLRSRAIQGSQSS
jgi:hypothetical protein